MGRIIVITSGKGGTGKTTTAAAVASCLAALGHRTLCVDFDAGLKNLDISLGMTDFAVTDFLDVLQGRAFLEDACTEHLKIPGLYFLSAPAFAGHEEIDPPAMARFYAACRAEFDYCLVDCPAGMGAGFSLAAAGADTAIIVATGDSASMRDGARVTGALSSLGVSDIRLLVNRIRPRQLRRIRATVDDVIDTVGARLIGLVSEDDAVYLAANTGVPLVLYSRKGAAMQYLRAARRIAGESLPLLRRAY